MFFRVQKSDVKPETELEIQLEELDFEYCLPRWFWTKFEWSKYMLGRIKILKEIERRDNEYSDR